MSPDSIKRSRGAPAGNTNAIKHGFYSGRYHPAEAAGLKKLEPLDLREEINLIRVYIRRLIEQVDEHATFEDHLIILRILCLASHSLTRLIRTQHYANPEDSAADQMEQALSEALKEINTNPVYGIKYTTLPNDLPLACPALPGPDFDLLAPDRS
jgi:hypothetical protein